MCNQVVSKRSSTESETEHDSSNHSTVIVSDTNDSPQTRTNNETTIESIRIEDIFTELGGYSWFQIWATLVVILPEIAAAMIAVAPVFTGTSNVAFTCVTPIQVVPLAQDPRAVLTKGTMYSGMDEFICSSNCSNRQPLGFSYASVVQEVSIFSNALCTVALALNLFGRYR